MNNRTKNAFLSRGIDSNLANELINKKFNLSKLKLKTEDELINLGLSENIAKNILKEQRPPIPENTVIKLLYESKRTCCVCRDNKKSIIIHHINEWHLSKDHSEENLVVLCLEHHNEAHTKKGLSLNLSEKQILKFKERWIKEVQNVDANAILGLTENDYARWDYFNHNRVFELFLNKNLKNDSFKTTYTVKTLGLINNLGTFPIKENINKPHCYNFSDGYMLAYYMKELFDSVLKTLPVIDLTDKFNLNDIKALVNVGSYISFQGGFYFKVLSKNIYGKNQRRLCYYKKNNIRLEFEFDAYETTSSSAWGDHLRGKIVVTPICFVKSVLEKKNELVISTSCLAIGSLFDNSEYRKKKYYS